MHPPCARQQVIRVESSDSEDDFVMFSDAVAPTVTKPHAAASGTCGVSDWYGFYAYATPGD